MMNNRNNILDLTSEDTKIFFLKQESYCSLDLPSYFTFENLLNNLDVAIQGRNLASFSKKSQINKISKVNHILYPNKDGKLSWRPLQLINPVMYIALINEITNPGNWKKLQELFKKFQSNPNIRCLSIPIQSDNKKSDKSQKILNWWESVEQESIALSLDYQYLFNTDIADCYASIYTHSIAWAIEGKEKAKENPKIANLGNNIDKLIRDMQYGQTNGIPQGSVLMDFIAEIVLGYVDLLLSKHLEEAKIASYKILRYRDDYRIFVKNYDEGLKILQILSEIMMPLGLKLNSSKTNGSQDIITQSIKNDKLKWLKIYIPDEMNLQTELLLIRQHSLEFPNSGSIIKALNKFDKKIESTLSNESKLIENVLLHGKKNINDSKQLISICSDIAYANPRTIPLCCSILSKLLVYEAPEISQKVFEKLNSSANSGYAQIWLQRMLKNFQQGEFKFTEKICSLIQDPTIESLWDLSWITDNKIKKILHDANIIKYKEYNKLPSQIKNCEVDIFIDKY